MRSVRQSLASSTADRSRLPRYCSSFGLESREQRERVGGRAGKAGQDPVVIEPPDLPGVLLDDRVAEGDLAVAGHHGLPVVPDREDGSGVKHGGNGQKRVYQRGRSCRPGRTHLPGGLTVFRSAMKITPPTSISSRACGSFLSGKKIGPRTG